MRRIGARASITITEIPDESGNLACADHRSAVELNGVALALRCGSYVKGWIEGIAELMLIVSTTSGGCKPPIDLRIPPKGRSDIATVG